MNGDTIYKIGAGILAMVAIFGFMGLALIIGPAFGGTGEEDQDGGGGAAGSVNCGSIETMDAIGGSDIPYPNTKLGLEGHLTETRPTHYVGPDSSPVNIVGPGAYAPHTTEQERWYFNEYWPLANNYSYEKYAHKKVLIQSTQTNKCVVGSIEEAGPATWVTARDGIGAGAPPEVHRALGLNPQAGYDANPNSNNNRINVSFVKDQENTPLGPTQ